ncbi:sigma-70 family RNA polymerase sigma factor [Gammaproteobacteria bacterium AS21]|jgi:RNA polymerase sigma-70 factor (ECF subfamily)
MMINLIWPTPKVVLNEVLLNALYRYALALTHNEHNAYDLLQNSCEKVLSLKDRDVLQCQQKLKSYMCRMIKNDFIDQYRKHKLELVVNSNFFAHDATEHETTQALESLVIDQQHVAIILKELAPKERELLFLWAVEGNTVQELADSTNTPRGTLLSRLSRLKKRLKQQHSYLIGQAADNERLKKDHKL